MIKKGCLFVLLSLILMSAAQACWAQEARQQQPPPLESLWINLPSTPLRFFANPSGTGYSLNNYSIGHIVRYRLGCVAEQSGGFKILSKRAPQDLSLRPMTGQEVYGREIIALVGPVFTPCRKGRLTVIEVQFKDGAAWKIR